MDIFRNSEKWFVSGSQHLYGEETLEKVRDDSRIIAAYLDRLRDIPVKIVFKPVLTSAGAISDLCLQANNEGKCIGLIGWMHTFSPSEMWLNGLKWLTKPFLHFHTQFNRDIPWNEIDMDFMNLNQSAHGGREFGFAATRLRMERKVVVGHWKDKSCTWEIATWSRAALALADTKTLKIARFGDNLRDVAVTEEGREDPARLVFRALPGKGINDVMKRIKENMKKIR